MWKKLNSLPFETLECQNWGFRVIGKRLKLEKIWFLQKAPILVPKDWTIETCPYFLGFGSFFAFLGVFWRFWVFLAFLTFLVFFAGQNHLNLINSILKGGNEFITPKNPQMDPLNVKIG